MEEGVSGTSFFVVSVADGVGLSALSAGARENRTKRKNRKVSRHDIFTATGAKPARGVSGCDIALVGKGDGPLSGVGAADARVDGGAEGLTNGLDARLLSSSRTPRTRCFTVCRYCHNISWNQLTWTYGLKLQTSSRLLHSKVAPQSEHIRSSDWKFAGIKASEHLPNQSSSGTVG